LAFSTPLTLSEHVVVIGAGPAGLTAAYELTKYQRLVTVVEKHDGVGGLARTVNYKGYHFDLDGHRFFTKAPEVQKLWMELLGVDFLARPRLSRIYYDGKFFHYPLRALSTFAGLGLLESMRIAASYLWRQLFPYRQVDTFEQWVTNRFGRRLFKIFFERYTEKVWGIPCSQLKAEWAAQRIQGLSARTALLGMLRSSGTAIRTLIDEFYYPRQGLVHRRREDIWSINTDGTYHEAAVEDLCPPESGSGPTSGRADGPAAVWSPSTPGS
jgi:protoporphyrinogen oxidase